MKTVFVAASIAAVVCMAGRADGAAAGDVWTDGSLQYEVAQAADESLYLKLLGSSVETNGTVVVPAEITRDETTLRVRGYGANAGKNFRGVALALPSEIFANADANGFKPSNTPGITNLVVVKSQADESYSIPQSAFTGNNRLRSVSLAGISSLEGRSFGTGAFASRGLLESLSLGDEMESIGGSSFYECRSLRAVSIPASVRTIGAHAFYNCTNISSLVFAPGVRQIGTSAFNLCKSLREVELPSTVTNVAEYAFSSCTSLTNYILHAEGGRVTGRFPLNLDNLTIRIVGDGETTIAPNAFARSSTWDTPKADKVVLTGVKAIEGTSGDGAFRNAQIGVLTMDDAMLDIGENAFYGAKIDEIAIADSVTNIGARAFYNCSTLSNFVMGAGVQNIGQSAFVYCYKIPEIVLPDSVTSVGQSAFTTCTAVTNIVIGSGLELIEPSRFPESVSATLTVNGSGETVIADGAFGSCKIRSATLRGVKKLGTGSSGAFRYCNRLETVEIGEGLVEIGEDSFYCCSALGSISLPDSLRVIGRGAFISCTNLRQIVFGPNVGEIGQNAFYYCSGLTDLEIPATVTNVQSSAFSRCPGITNVVIHSAGGRITSNWLPHGGDDVTVSIIGDGETTIAPKAFYSDTFYNNPITPKTVKFSGVKAIENASHGNGAFFHSEVESIDLGSAMRNIGDYAFQRAERLEFIDVPGSVTNIGREAFSDCPRLSRVRLREGLVSIGAQAFNSSKAITYIEIPSTVTQIASSAFQNSSHSLVVFFRGPPPEGIGSLAFVKGARVVRPKAYAAEWEGVTVSANAKIVPEPEEGVTWTVNTDRDWAHLDGIVPHSGMVLADETWTADKVHVVRGWVTVTNGASVTVERGAVVKFCPGMGVYAMPDARFDVSGATVTHIRDDGIAGDTDGDSGLFKPVAGDYSFMGWIDEDSGTSWRCRLFHVEGDIASDTVWAGGGNVYYADDNITVNSKIALTVEPGAIVKFAENKRIVVRGTLNATGTRQEPVYFTSCHDDTLGGDNNGNGDATNPNWGDWYHIIVSGAATFDHAILRYGGTRSSSYTKGVVIADNGSDVRLSCCTIAESWNMGVWAAAGSKRMAVENCVFSAIQNSAAWLLGGANSFRNCVFSGCQSIVGAGYNTSFYSETPSFRNCVFTGFDRWFNDTSIETDDNVQFSHCCFWNRRDANSDVCEMAGTDGNIFVDPGFADAENGDWRITSASPCVDAGDASAPERDAYGQPRQNVKAVPTGVRNANGRYADIGIYEVIPLSGAEDAPDLEVFDLSAPTAMTVGSEATVTYKLCNVSDENDVLGEVRVDRVELIDSNGTAVEVYRAARPAVRIARRRGTVLSESATFTAPALSPGIVTVRVTVNCERDIFEGVLYENNTVQKGAVRLEAPEVTFDSLAGRTLAIPAGGSFSCHLAGEQAAERLLVLRGGEAGAITARTATDGAMPTAGAFATQSVAPGGSDSLLVLPAGETVSLAIGNSGGTTANVTLQDLGTGLVLYDPGEAVTAVNTNFLYNATRKRQNGIMKDFREIEVRNYVPSSPKGLYVRAGAKYVGLDTNAMRVVQMRFWGNGFTDGTTAALVCGGRRIEPMEFTVNSRTSAYASFEYYGCEPGEYALEVSDGGTVRTTGTRFALWEPVDYYLNGGDELRLLPGNPDELEVSVSKFPSKLRGGRVYTGAVSWRNSTDKDLDAPYLRLVAVNDHIRLNESRPWGTQIDVIGLSATPPYDKIKPGESRTMSFQFIAPDSDGYIDVPVALNTPLKGTQENATPSDLPSGRGTTRFLNNQVRAVRLQTLPGKPSGPVAADGTEAYPWDQNAPYYRSPAMNDELWTLFYSQMRSLYGETWGTFSARLRSRAAAFAGAYRKPPVAIETGDITCADGMRIIGDSRVCPVIETACDLKRPGRGAAFKLERTYGSTLQNRMSDGIFGRGWTTVFDVRLVKRGDSEASISRPGWTGSRYAMAPDDTVWRKTAGAGQSTFDGRVERHADGSYNVFADDGLLSCCYDRYGNGYAIERDGSRRITKVQHSDGAYFTFEYSGSSPVPSRVTDDVGNEATYTYTVSDGVYMLASVETSRGTAEYTYREADATAASCALVRLEGGGPNMATCSLTWDARGRVTSITEYDSFTKEFIYETDDRIRIVDASGHETVIEFTPWGDVASSTQPDGGVARLEYEEGISQPVGYVWPSGRRVDCEFDAAGNLVQMTSSTGKSTKFTYNNESDLSQVSSVMGTRTYSFDENGEYSGVRSGTGRSMSFGWNSETGDLAEESYPDGVHGWNYEYGQYGLLSSIVSKDSKLRYRYEYDAEGRIVRAAVVRKAASEAQASASLMSASGTRRAARLFGNPPDDGEETCVETLVYDSKGRLQSFTSNGHTVEFGYDKKGRLTSIIDEDGEGERFTYDSKGRVTQVIDAADSSIVHVTYAYDDMHGGRLASETFGNGMVTTYGYTVNGKVASVRTMYGDNPIAEYWYTYNRDGKISACGEAVAGERNDFLYNGDGQIVDVVYTDPDGKKQDSSNVTEAKKTYDDVLGYLTKLEKGDVEWEYLYDEFNYLAEIKNGDGNTTVTYERDAYGKVVSITVDGKKTEKVKIPSKDYTINIYEEDGTKKHVINSPMGTVGVTVSGGSSGSGKKQNYNVKDKNGTTKQTVDRDGNRTSYQSCNQRKDATDNSTTTPAQTYYGDPDEQIEESSSNRNSSTQKQNQDSKDTGKTTAKQSENPDDTGAKVSPDACYLPENNEQNSSKWGPAEQLQWEKQQQREEAARQAAEAAAQEQKQKEEEEARKAEEAAQQAAEQDRKENARSLKDILDDSDNSLVNLIDELYESLADETDASMSRNRNRKKQKKKEAREHLDNAKEEAKDLAVDAVLKGLPKKVKPVVKPLKKALDNVNCP